MDRRKRAGFSLVEVMTVVVVLGLVAAIVGPRMAGMAAVARVRGAANRVAADLAYARHLAVRNGCVVRLVLEPSADCAAEPGWTAGHRYRVEVDGRRARAEPRDLRLDGGPVCLAFNGNGPVVFTARGLPLGFNNRTLVVRQARHPPDTLTLSSVGRVLRRY